MGPQNMESKSQVLGLTERAPTMGAEILLSLRDQRPRKDAALNFGKHAFAFFRTALKLPLLHLTSTKACSDLAV